MFRRVTLDRLGISDEKSVGAVEPYARLKRALLDDGASYLVLPEGPLARWDHALLLNLTYWRPDQQDDVLPEPSVPADVVAHRAWHHVAHRALGEAGDTPEGLLFAESIASAFDVFLVGQLLTLAPEAEMLQTQVPAMSDAMAEAGLDADASEELIQRIARGPEVAFELLRELLYDVGTALREAQDVESGLQALADHQDHPFSPLLHHYELSNWTLYARAFAHDGDARTVASLDAELRSVPDPLAHLIERWL